MVWKKIDKREALTGFLVGIDGGFFLFVIFLSTNLFWGTSIPDFSSVIYAVIYFFLVAGLLEEVFKFFLITRFRHPLFASFFVGFGYALIEQYFKVGLRYFVRTFENPLFMKEFWFNPSTSFFTQILLAVLMGYFIKIKKPMLGLIIAVLFHTLMDVVMYSN